MNIETLLNQLGTLELRQLAFDEAGCLDNKQKQQIYFAMKLALEDLYIKFDLSNKAIKINFTESNRYLLHSSNVGDYLEELDGDKFDNTLIKVIRVTDICDKNIPLNKTGEICSVLTSNQKTIVVNKTIREMYPDGIKVYYKATHPHIDKDCFEGDDEYELELPNTHNKVLIFNIAHRIYSPMGAVNETASLGNDYFTKYLQACEELTNEGIEIDENSSKDGELFEQQGWR